MNRTRAESENGGGEGVHQGKSSIPPKYSLYTESGVIRHNLPQLCLTTPDSVLLGVVRRGIPTDAPPPPNSLLHAEELEAINECILKG